MFHTVRRDSYLPSNGARQERTASQTREQVNGQTLKSVCSIGTGEWTDAEKCVLYWNQRRYQKTIYLDTKETNVATMRLAPGYADFNAYCTEIGIGDSIRDDILYDMDPIIASPAQATDGDEADVEHDEHERISEEPHELSLAGPQSQEGRDEAPAVVVDEEDRLEQMTSTTELLLNHYRFGHISFHKLQAMAEKGILPKRLARCNIPTCSACMYAKATKRP